MELDSYVNEFTIRMLAPTTQEELDRRENLTNKVALTADIMNMLTDIEDPQSKLKILKSLLSNILTNGDVISIIQEEIDKLENKEEENSEDDISIDTEDDTSISSSIDDFSLSDNSELDASSEDTLDFDLNNSDLSADLETIEPATDMNLPTGEDLGIDLTQNV